MFAQCRLTVCILFACIAIHIGCVSRMTRISNALAFYGQALSLEVKSERTNATIGEILPVRLILKNNSAQVIDACIGISEGYNMFPHQAVAKGKPLRLPRSGEMTWIDHPYCAARLRLQPGASMSIDKCYLMLDVGAGAAVLDLWIQIVHPKDCDQYGCYDTKLHGSLALTLVEKEDTEK